MDERRAPAKVNETPVRRVECESRPVARSQVKVSGEPAPEATLGHVHQSEASVREVRKLARESVPAPVASEAATYRGNGAHPVGAIARSLYDANVLGDAQLSALSVEQVSRVILTYANIASLAELSGDVDLVGQVSQRIELAQAYLVPQDVSALDRDGALEGSVRAGVDAFDLARERGYAGLEARLHGFLAKAHEFVSGKRAQVAKLEGEVSARVSRLDVELGAAKAEHETYCRMREGYDALNAILVRFAPADDLEEGQAGQQPVECAVAQSVVMPQAVVEVQNGLRDGMVQPIDGEKITRLLEQELGESSVYGLTIHKHVLRGCVEQATGEEWSPIRFRKLMGSQPELSRVLEQVSSRRLVEYTPEFARVFGTAVDKYLNGSAAEESEMVQSQSKRAGAFATEESSSARESPSETLKDIIDGIVGRAVFFGEFVQRATIRQAVSKLTGEEWSRDELRSLLKSNRKLEELSTTRSRAHVPFTERFYDALVSTLEKHDG